MLNDILIYVILYLLIYNGGCKNIAKGVQKRKGEVQKRNTRGVQKHNIHRNVFYRFYKALQHSVVK